MGFLRDFHFSLPYNSSSRRCVFHVFCFGVIQAFYIKPPIRNFVHKFLNLLKACSVPPIADKKMPALRSNFRPELQRSSKTEMPGNPKRQPGIFSFQEVSSLKFKANSYPGIGGTCRSQFQESADPVCEIIFAAEISSEVNAAAIVGSIIRAVIGMIIGSVTVAPAKEPVT
jgi:hypothetical protein